MGLVCLSLAHAGLLEMCLTLGLQITGKAEETPLHVFITSDLINLWSKAYVFQVDVQTSSIPWLALAAPALLAPALRVQGCQGNRLVNISLPAIAHGCWLMSHALPLNSRTASVPNYLWPITQAALISKQQDPQGAPSHDLHSFDLLPKYKVIFQYPLLMHISCLCFLPVVHAGAFAALCNQPFVGGGKASPPTALAQRLMSSFTPKEIVQRNAYARDLLLLSCVLQPLDEVLQQLVELRQAHKQLGASAGQENNSSGNNDISTKAEHVRQVGCGVAASSESGGVSSSRSRGGGEGSSTGRTCHKNSGGGRVRDGEGTSQGAASSSDWINGSMNHDTASGPEDACHNAAADTAAGAGDGQQPCHLQTQGQQQAKEQQQAMEQQQAKEQQQGSLPEVVSDAQVDWLFFNRSPPGSLQQRLVVDLGGLHVLLDDGMLLQVLEYLIETLLALWPKPTAPMPAPDTASSSSSNNGDAVASSAVQQQSSSELDIAIVSDKQVHSSGNGVAKLVIQQGSRSNGEGSSSSGGGGSSRGNDGNSSSDGSGCLGRYGSRGNDKGGGSRGEDKDGGTCSTGSNKGSRDKDKGCGRDGGKKGSGTSGSSSSSKARSGDNKGCGTGEEGKGGGTGNNKCRSEDDKGRGRGEEAKDGGGGGQGSNEGSGEDQCGGGSSGKCGSDGSSGSSCSVNDRCKDLQHEFKSPETRWPWILTLAAVFQRASLGGRLKFLEQGQSTLLLQLLYQVLLEDRGLGGQGMGVRADGAMALSVSESDVDVGEVLAAISGTGVPKVTGQLWEDGHMVGVEVHILVLLVLQCLLYKPLRADKETLKKLQPSRLMLLHSGKGLYCYCTAMIEQDVTGKSRYF
jgi:hypothetical protein